MAVGSRSHASHGTAQKGAHLGIGEFVASSSSLKFCLVAEGAADLYPRYGTTAEWDTAAGQAILEAAGGRVTALDEAGAEAGPLRYAKIGRAFLNPHFIAWGA
jgi:3'(2'), 5'-bisphosphate nucleotidase